MNEQEYKIKGWVARDLNDSLYIHLSKPFNNYEDSSFKSNEYFEIDGDLFSELQYPNEPIEVELTIKKI